MDLFRSIAQALGWMDLSYQHYTQPVFYMALLTFLIFSEPMDATEHDRRAADGEKIHPHNMLDLGSRYKFLPMAGGYPVGEEIAGYLIDKFFRFGPIEN